MLFPYYRRKSSSIIMTTIITLILFYFVSLILANDCRLLLVYQLFNLYVVYVNCDNKTNLFFLYGIRFALALQHLKHDPSMAPTTSTTTIELKELMEFNNNFQFPIKLTATNYPAWYKQVRSTHCS